MRTLYQFNFQYACRQQDLDAERLRELCDVVARFSDFGGQPWNVLGKFAGEPLEVAHPAEAMVKVAACAWQPAQRETTLAYVSCSRPGYERKRDESVGVWLQELRHIEIRLNIEIDETKQESLFSALALQLDPPEAHYLPILWGPGGDSSAVLFMALERNYFMRSDCDDVAKAIAPLLPRLTWQQMAGKDGLPARLGWLNYWSPRVAQALGFPAPAKDAQILPLCRQLDNGAWMVKLTADPLDLTRSDHAQAIASAYWRFDKVGRRKQRTAKSVKPRVKQAESDTIVAAGLLPFVLRERDEHGQWWDLGARPIHAASAEDALRIYFARNAHSRSPKPRETLAKLRDDYDGIAAEVGLTRGEDIEAIPAEQEHGS
ncbi:MAG TPA: DUF5953 family protein [Burkholderiaceae bacterium]|nr:DUF5953 family protein [Burkholderiaceae bacterium]